MQLHIPTVGTFARLVAAGGLMAAMLPGAVPVAAAQVDCGDVVTTNIKLSGDLGPCPGDGLVVGASDILIDTGGHIITGDDVGLGGGVRIESPHRNVEVRHGTITGFNEGVVLAGTSGNHVWRLRLVDNNRGIDLAGFNSGNLIEKNEAIGNAGDGIRIDASSDNTVHKNTIVGNVFGISVSNGADDNVITKNDVSDGAPGFSFGISVFSNSDRNVVEKNRVTGMALEGIQVESSSDGTLISKNMSTENGTDGILVEPAGGPFEGHPQGTVIVKNTADGNGDDGIDVVSPSTTLTKNSARHNGDLGIEAVAGVIDGGGNRASENGDAVQCTSVVCK